MTRRPGCDTVLGMAKFRARPAIKGSQGRADDLGGTYFRSKWERNYARFLNYLVSVGRIARWEYEPDTFDFPVRRGVTSYTPDFKVWLLNGTHFYVEVKGYLDATSKTKLSRMAKYHPDQRVRLVDTKEYGSIRRYYRERLPAWED